MGRVSKDQAVRNRAKVLEAASLLFRSKGIESVGIAEVMSQAGLTHGGFYGQFGSKEALAGEACAHAFEAAEQAWKSMAARGTADFARAYFATDPERVCPMATLAGDAAHAPVGSPLRRAFTDGVRRLAARVARREPDDESLAVFAAMVGAVVLKRASDDPDLSRAIEDAVLRLADRNEMEKA